MDPIGFLGRDILEMLREARASEEVVDYVKIDGDEFVKLVERGFYLHARHGTGVIQTCRIYFAGDEDYFASAPEARGRFAGLVRVAEFEALLGKPRREIPSLRIPGRPPTRPGKEFRDGALVVKAYHDEDGTVIYLHVAQAEA